MKLSAYNISFSYAQKKILNDVSLFVNEGEFVTILGPSGCGKSTLLNVLCGILKSDSGEILIDDKSVSNLSSHFAYMPQQDLLLPWKTIVDNVCLYSSINLKSLKDKKDFKQKALSLFEQFGLKGYEKSYPNELSGGMRQRAAFLRTCLCTADILLLDEPFGALDVITRADMQDWLLSIKDTLKKTTLLVTHDIDEAIFLSDRILILNNDYKGFKKEIIVSEKNRDRQWLFNNHNLRSEIYSYLR